MDSRGLAEDMQQNRSRWQVTLRREERGGSCRTCGDGKTNNLIHLVHVCRAIPPLVLLLFGVFFPQGIKHIGEPGAVLWSGAELVVHYRGK